MIEPPSPHAPESRAPHDPSAARGGRAVAALPAVGERLGVWRVAAELFECASGFWFRVEHGKAAAQTGLALVYRHEVDAQAVLSAAGLTCFPAASAATARQTLADAVAAASHGTLAALLLPTNVQLMNVEVWGSAQPKLPAAMVPTGARKQSIDAVVDLLEPRGEWIARLRANDTAFDQPHRTG